MLLLRGFPEGCPTRSAQNPPAVVAAIIPSTAVVVEITHGFEGRRQLIGQSANLFGSGSALAHLNGNGKWNLLAISASDCCFAWICGLHDAAPLHFGHDDCICHCGHRTGPGAHAGRPGHCCQLRVAHPAAGICRVGGAFLAMCLCIRLHPPPAADHFCRCS